MPDQPSDNFNNTYSPKTKEILSRYPNWLIRYSMGLFFVILIFILIGTYLIKYPEVITAPVKISSNVPPAFIVSSISGEVDMVFVKDKEHVQAQKPIMLIKNTSNYEDIVRVIDCLENIDFRKPVICLTDLGQPQLGELQPSFAALVESYQLYQLFINDDYYSRKIEAVERQIKQYEKLDETLSKQIHTQQLDYALTRKRYAIDSLLLKENVISELDKDASKSLLLQKKNAFLQSASNRTNSALQKEELIKSKLELTKEVRELNQKLKLDLNSRIGQLKSEIKSWEQKYLLESPIDGTVSFHFVNKEHQNVRNGQEIASVVPDNNEIVAMAALSSTGAGEVHIGQKVNLKLYDFPFEKFGYLIGEVIEIANVARDSVYRVEIGLSEGLKTNYGKQLEFRPEMIGEAEIVTEDLRLIERFFYRLKKATDI